MSARSWNRRLLHGVRDVAFAGAHAAGLWKVYRRFWGPGRVVLTYHNVLPREALTGAYPFRVDLAVETFEAQIEHLLRGWEVLPARDHSGTAPGVVITFDDGMLNAATVVAPILARHGVTALFAVCPGLIDGELPYLWRDHLYLILRAAAGGSLRLPMDGYAQPVPVGDDPNPLGARLRSWVVDQRVADVYALVREICERNQLPYERGDHLPDRFWPLSWDQVRELERQGHVIASHTVSHRILSGLPAAERAAELLRSRLRLEEMLGHPVDAIVYPYGGPAEVDAATMRQARECGYTTGFVNVARMSDGIAGMDRPRYTLPATASDAHLSAVLSGAKHALLGR